MVGQQEITWTRTAKDRDSWRTVAEGYFLHWKEMLESTDSIVF